VSGATLTEPSRETSFSDDDRICITNRKLGEDVAVAIDEIDRDYFERTDGLDWRHKRDLRLEVQAR